MKETLLLLGRLYAVDQERDATWDEMKRLERDLAATGAQVVELKAEVAQVEAARAEATTAERQVHRELERYGGMRDRTRAQLDAGAVPDYLSAERQLANYLEIIDGMETDLLERMEAREGLEHRIDALGMRVRHRQATQAEQALAAETEGPLRKAELDVLNRQRRELTPLLPPHLLREYESLREVHRDAVILLQDGACQACRMVQPPQVVLEVRRGSHMHRCRGCTRFLGGVVEAEDLATEESAAE